MERPPPVNVQERLRQAIDQQQNRLRGSVPFDREAAILALIRRMDRKPLVLSVEATPDLVFGHHLANLGGNKALQLCLESVGDAASVAPASSNDGLDGWVEGFLRECHCLAEAEQVLVHCETGF